MLPGGSTSDYVDPKSLKILIYDIKVSLLFLLEQRSPNYGIWTSKHKVFIIWLFTESVFQALL